MGDSVAGGGHPDPIDNAPDPIGSKTDLVGVALAAGAGRRLAPLTLERPKVLCPVGGRPLLGWALDSLIGVVDDVAVNVHHHPEAMLGWLSWVAAHQPDQGAPAEDFWRAHAEIDPAVPRRSEVRRLGSVASGWGGSTGGRVRRHPPAAKADLWASIEGPEALGTAGALAALAGFLDGRGVLAVNADSIIDVDLAAVVAAWDGERPLVAHGGVDQFRPGVPVVASITPWAAIVGLPATPSGLFGHLWRDAHAGGRLQSMQVDGSVLDCGTPRSYLEANLWLSGGDTSVEADGAAGPREVTRSVLWSGAPLTGGEALDGAIRTTDGRTVLVRPVPEMVRSGPATR